MYLDISPRHKICMHHCFATPDSFQAALDGMAGEEINAK
jgi:hypothetical protein